MSIIRFMTAGSVDDGKSTLIGRLFHDSGLILKDQLANMSKHGLNLAHFTDGLKEEREAGITIDVAYRYFETAGKKFIVADAPGHKEFTRNMISAASNSDMVLILVDATRGVSEQTRRHTSIAKWMGLNDVTYLINKMDLVDYKEEVFHSLQKELKQLSDFPAIPISALEGDNVIERSPNMPWYNGKSILEILLSFTPEAHEGKVSFPVQMGIGSDALGTLASGEISVGMTLKQSSTGDSVVIENILKHQEELQRAKAGEAVRLTLNKALTRGDLLIEVSQNSEQGLVWNAEWCHLLEDTSVEKIQLKMKHHLLTVEVDKLHIEEVFHLETGKWTKDSSGMLRMNHIYRGKIYLKNALTKELSGRAIYLDQESGTTSGAVLLKSPGK